jgi:hypothetical protein
MAEVAVPPEGAPPVVCGGCRSDLAAATRYDSDGLLVDQCPLCGFYNWRGQGPTVLAMASLTDGLADGPEIAAALGAASETAAVCEALMRLEEALVASVKRAATAPPRLVDATLWRLIDECERRMAANRKARRPNEGHVSLLTRAIGLLLAIILEDRSPGLPDPHAGGDASDSFVASLRRVVVHAMEVLVGMRNVRLGFATPRVDGGNVLLEPTLDHERVWEWENNRREILSRAMRHATPALEEAFSRALLRSQELVWGVSLNAAGAQVERMLAGGAGRPVMAGSGVRALDPASCSEHVRRVLELHSLTRSRLARFEAPLFWDLGEQEQTPSTAEAARMKAATQNWTAYYPLFTGEDDEGRSWCVVPWQMFRTVMDIVGTFKSQILEALYDRARAARGRTAALTTQLGELRQEANRVFERIAAQAGRECGWRATGGVTQIDGRKLAAGDLDVVLARVDGSRLTLILGEVKDFDLSLTTPKARERMQAKIDGAYAQLRAKASEVRPVFRALARSLGIEPERYSSARLVLAVITSDYLPPHMFHAFPGVAVDTLPIMLDDVANDSQRARALYGRGISDLS